MATLDLWAQGVPASSRLAPLTLESSNALLPPLSSHLRSDLTRQSRLAQVEYMYAPFCINN